MTSNSLQMGVGCTVSIRESATAELRLEVIEFKGRLVFNCRVWEKPEGADAYRPTKAAFALAVERLPEFAVAVIALGKQARAQGLLPDPGRHDA